MENRNFETSRFIFEFHPQFTNVAEYGIPLSDLLAGTVKPHPAGARIDVAFKGPLNGPDVKGEISGVDYVNIRADGRLQLHIHAQIATDNGVNIAYASEGIALPQENSPVLQIRQTVSMVTASPEYEWLNYVYGLVIGTSNPSAGKASLSLYNAESAALKETVNTA